jgi:hypothetical protein
MMNNKQMNRKYNGKTSISYEGKPHIQERGRKLGSFRDKFHCKEFVIIEIMNLKACLSHVVQHKY